MAGATFIDPGVAAGEGYTSPDYEGSYQQWLYRASRSMAQRYASGDQSMVDGLQFNWSTVGAPDGADFGSMGGGKTGTISYQTYDFFQRYLAAHPDDAWVTNNFGTPPTAQASWESPDVTINGTWKDRNAADMARDAADNASAEKIAAGHDAANLAAAQASAAAQVQAATISANASIANTTAQVNESWKEATLHDATQRYIAEGDWGTQKYIAQLQEKGQMDRLQLQLAQDDKHLAADAIAEANHHQEAEQALQIQVAQIDANLAAQPRNWIAYAAWLKNRGMVVNGTNLATAAQVVPQSAISPQEVANAGGGVAAIQQAQTIAAAATTGPDGQQISLEGDQQNTVAPATQNGQGATGAAPTLASQGQQAGSTGLSLQNLDYAGIANKILGLGDNTAPTTQQLQDAYNSLGQSSSHQSGFGDWSGPTTNSLGMTVNANGAKVDLRKYSNLLPAQQDMDVGAASSVGKYEPDFLEEMKRAAPKGAATGTAGWG